MTTLLSDQSADWFSPETVARLLGRRDVGFLIEVGLIRSEWVNGEYHIPADAVAEFQARYGGE
jgi:hypothetical protein